MTPHESPTADVGFAGCSALITGGLGFIGSHVARRLVGLGARVTVVDSLIPEYGGNLQNISDIAGQLRINVSDVRDPHSFRSLLAGQDYLFNLAGQTSHQDSMDNPFTDLEINCTAQLSILEACRQYNPGIRIVFASTRQIYGRPDYLPVDERHPLRPVDVNGINKLAGENYHQLYQQVYDIPTCALRLTNTYGPAMRIKDARQTFLGIWIRRLLEDEPFEVWGGAQLRDFNYVDDVVDALLLAIRHPNAEGKVFNLGSPEVVSLTALAQQLVAAHGRGGFSIRDFPAERKKIDIGDYYSDYRALAALGWQPQVSLASGLTRTLAYFREHLEHYR